MYFDSSGFMDLAAALPRAAVRSDGELVRGLCDGAGGGLGHLGVVLGAVHELGLLGAERRTAVPLHFAGLC